MNETTRRHIDKSRWPRLSPLLDELLDLPPEQRPARLQALEAQDQELAADLRELLWRQEAMDAAQYLATPALQTMEAQQPSKANNSAGQQLGAYTLEREIGQGGMGTVWLARRTDGRFDGLAAIKFLNAGLLGRGDAGRFAREGQILARLAHPHIARLIDAGISDSGEQPYLVLEYVDGLPLDQYCESKALTARERVTLFQDVLAAVAHAHTRLILHRDLKPSNILVTAAGEVKLLDFGIAKLLHEENGASNAAATELTALAGRAYTPRYAAPEQVQGGEVSTATDVYALGVLLYLLLCGQHPTTPGIEERTTPLERMRTLVEVAPKKLSDQVPDRAQARELRGDLDTIVAKALKKLPAERYTNAAELAEDLRRWLSDEPIAARPDSRAYVLSKFIRRHRAAVAAGTAGVLALAALTTLSVAQAWRAERAEKLALQRSAEADDLLGYMLGEFADKLRPIGRMELLNDVGAKALAHLKLANAVEATQAAGPTMTPNSILQRAKALTVLGEVSVNKRELDAAVEPLLAARKLLAGASPEPGLANDWRKAQGTAAFWLGHVYYTKRQLAPAKLAWEDYRLGSEAWLRDAPGQFEPLRELAYALTNLGVLALERGEISSAVGQFQDSQAMKQQAVVLMPQDLSLRGDFAEGFSWLGSALVTQGDFMAGRRSFEAGLEQIAKARTLAPHDLDWIEREATMRLHLGRVLLRLKDSRLGLTTLQQAHGQFQDLLQTEPARRTWRQALIRTKLTLAEASPTNADASLAKASIEQLIAMDQGTGAATSLRRLPLRTQASLALAKDLQAQQQGDAAQALLTNMLPSFAQALSKQPDNLLFHIANAKLRLDLAALAKQHGDEAAAHAQCVTLIDELQGQRRLLQLHYEITEVWVQAHSCLGRQEAVQAEQDWLRSKLGT
ncbi:serine/threonine protein kinase [Paucibacter sp. B2R-40]|uniref:serine/threonine-protein kinase n=1 Tax=Paucibacter sp. B2R-40 TaxID=2893554 RepID=UPI0021E4FDB5|nr:serine/threonine-protein kinase [Paucibacter sp. B2R-40]MCV2353122.1 serine/threonine protein kinase [Paucibacter sp. B2R-40]